MVKTVLRQHLTDVSFLNTDLAIIEDKQIQEIYFDSFEYHHASGHGPFPTYLHCFKFLDSTHCIFGMMGDAGHYNFSCPLTKEFHLIKPADEHKKAWFNNLFTIRQAVTKVEGAFKTSRNICETFTQERDHNRPQ
ncbi:hypothetical protein AVEN_81593-1 [Araneus ventricosus]|uniref:Uncharacterized protein n=1 Tax=Araneus ventricosus TaxID=182803 RepID=A0A4Y2FMS7_ARAVE|nr:hypothetical protein AVEN_81593-1 [Araneus ventricosus]